MPSAATVLIGNVEQDEIKDAGGNATMLSADLGGIGSIGYMYGMAKSKTPSTVTTVRDAKTGRNVTVLGVGALRGHLTLRKGVDLTKPIALQAMKGGKRRPTAASA